MLGRSVAFWKIYFDSICQRVSDTVRLRPTNLVQRDIYDTLFKPFCEQLRGGLPSLSTFRRALKHPEFKDISRRDKHNHVRCTTCATLAAEKARAFKAGGADLEEIMIQVTPHHQTTDSLQGYNSGLCGYVLSGQSSFRCRDQLEAV